MCGSEIQPFVKHTRRATTVPDPGHGHNLLTQVAPTDGHTGHYGNQIAEHGNRRNNVPVFQVAKVAGAVSPFGRRIVLRHVLHENVARRHTLHQERPDVANHGRDPVFLFQRVACSDGNRFLPEAGVKPADNFVLPEELDHGVFHGAVQPHVVIQVEVLLRSQFPEHLLGHCCSHFRQKPQPTAPRARASQIIPSSQFPSNPSRTMPPDV